MLQAIVDIANLSAIEYQAEVKQIEIHAELPERALVTALPARIKQVLLNLVDNAVKYTPPGGRVHIAVTPTTADSVASREARDVVVTVTDTGAGIRAMDLPYVFHKFYRARGAAADAQPGTGLGLAIAKSIVELHGGRIWVRSDEGSGSTFAFSLPARPSHH